MVLGGRGSQNGSVDSVYAIRHAARNRAAFMLSHLADLRVGEIAALRMDDVFDSDGEVPDQILLKPSYTKGKQARMVFVGDKLCKELARFGRAA